MKLTKLQTETALKSAEGSSLERRAVVTNLTMTQLGSIIINYSIEVKDVNGDEFTPKTTPQDIVIIGSEHNYFDPNIEDNEVEASHITEFKKTVATALGKLMKIELKDK